MVGATARRFDPMTTEESAEFGWILFLWSLGTFLLIAFCFIIL